MKAGPVFRARLFRVRMSLSQVRPGPRLAAYRHTLEQPQRGIEAIGKHDKTIEAMSQKHGVDPDILRAIMYMENARGHQFGLNSLADTFGVSDTKFPMNIDPDLWGELLGEPADFNDPAQNIEAATILIKRISDRLEEPSPEAVASIWNYLGREGPSDLGAYVGRAYDEKPWRSR